MFGAGRMKAMTPGQLHVRQDVQILHVREDDEWHAGHIDGSRHFPIGIGQVARRIDELDEDRPVVTVCRSGRRSRSVARRLSKRGHDAANPDGGLQAWADAGLPLTWSNGTTGKVI